MGCSSSRIEVKKEKEAGKKIVTEVYMNYYKERETNRLNYINLKEKIHKFQSETNVNIPNFGPHAFYNDNKEILELHKITSEEIEKYSTYVYVREQLREFDNFQVKDMIIEILSGVPRHMNNPELSTIKNDVEEFKKTLEGYPDAQYSVPVDVEDFKEAACELMKFYKYDEEFQDVEAINIILNDVNFSEQICCDIAEIIEHFKQCISVFVAVYSSENKSNNAVLPNLNPMGKIFGALKRNKNIKAFAIGSGDQTYYDLSEENQKLLVEIFDNESLILSAISKFNLNYTIFKTLINRLTSHKNLKGFVLDTPLNEELIQHSIKYIEKSKNLKGYMLFGAQNNHFMSRAQEIKIKNSEIKFSVIGPSFCLD